MFRPWGLAILALYFFNSYQDSLKHVMIRTCSSRSYSLIPSGFCQPVFIPLIIAIISTLSSMSLHSCPHLMFSSFPRFIICLSSCRPFAFCLATFHVVTHIFASPLTSSWSDAYYIIPPPPLSHLVHVDVISIHFTTLRVCMSMFHSFPS